MTDMELEARRLAARAEAARLLWSWGWYELADHVKGNEAT